MSELPGFDETGTAEDERRGLERRLDVGLVVLVDEAHRVVPGRPVVTEPVQMLELRFDRLGDALDVLLRLPLLERLEPRVHDPVLDREVDRGVDGEDAGDRQAEPFEEAHGTRGWTPSPSPHGAAVLDPSPLSIEGSRGPLRA